jgi:hypothetical protein
MTEEYVPETPLHLPNSVQRGEFKALVPSYNMLGNPEVTLCQDSGNLKFVAKFKNKVRKYYAAELLDARSSTGSGLKKSDHFDNWRCGVCTARMIGGDSCAVCCRW